MHEIVSHCISSCACLTLDADPDDLKTIFLPVAAGATGVSMSCASMMKFIGIMIWFMGKSMSCRRVDEIDRRCSPQHETTVVHVLLLLVHPHDHGVMQPPDSYGLRMLPSFPALWW